MSHAVLIASAPDSDTHRHAEAFCLALSRRTEIKLIYFAGDGVLITQPHYQVALERWLRIARDHEVQLWVCSGSMSDLPPYEPPKGVEIAGHASWVEASQTVDQLISFPA